MIKEKSKHQVVVFMAEWCPHCKNMKDHTWKNEDVLNAVKPYHGGKPAFVVCSKPQNRHLVQEFDIEKYPTVVIMDEDHNVTKQANNMSPEEVIEFLEKPEEEE
tara:strand:- start:247 stop:558 length:312 start_codon:yes stop_codon:yes gene_type:complete